jgi:hypothetical protein
VAYMTFSLVLVHHFLDGGYLFDRLVLLCLFLLLVLLIGLFAVDIFLLTDVLIIRTVHSR